VNITNQIALIPNGDGWRVVVAAKLDVHLPNSAVDSLKLVLADAAERWATIHREEIEEAENALPHEPSSYLCLVHHVDAPGNTLPQCERCRHCKQWIRPENMGDSCPARNAEAAQA